MPKYWIETRLFAAPVGELTPEQRTCFVKWCNDKAEEYNRLVGKTEMPEFIVCDFTQKWEPPEPDTRLENIREFWRAIKECEDILDRQDFACFLVKILPEDVINVNLEGLPPDNFVDKRMRYNEVRNDTSLQRDFDKEDLNWLSTFLGYAEAVCGNYEKPNTQSEQPPVNDGITPAMREAYREDLKAILSECLQQPIPVYRVPHPNPVTQEDIDELLDGIDVLDERWVSRKEYADAIGCAESTLQKYREAKHDVKFSSKNPLMGIDGGGNIFCKIRDKHNAPSLYFLRDGIPRASHTRNGK